MRFRATNLAAAARPLAVAMYCQLCGHEELGPLLPEGHERPDRPEPCDGRPEDFDPDPPDPQPPPVPDAIEVAVTATGGEGSHEHVRS